MNINLLIQNQLNHTIKETHLSSLGKQSIGKVRDSYQTGTHRYLVATDRLSCFDRVVTTIPFKGQVLTQLAWFWFQKTAHLVPNHVVSLPDPNVMYVKEVEIIPVEVVVRGYLAGSAWRDYVANRPVSGVSLPEGMKRYEAFPEPLITPSTKAPNGEHDEPISEKDLLSRGIVSEEVWSNIRTAALKLFAFGQEHARKRDLILVDTKYEFGLLEGQVTLADEIHTLDSSRYWERSSYESALSNGESPDMLDKETVRQWLLSEGFQGDGEPPTFSDQFRTEIALQYISAFERITGDHFVPESRLFSERASEFI